MLYIGHCKLTTFAFIGIIDAVILAVTDEVGGDAHFVATPELVSPTLLGVQFRLTFTQDILLRVIGEVGFTDTGDHLKQHFLVVWSPAVHLRGT